MPKNIYVGNLPYTFSEDQLHQLFQSEGKIVKTNLITDRFTGQSKGFGFVEMENEEEASTAITKLHNMEVEGRKLVVNEARPRADRPKGGGGGMKKKSFGKRW